MSVSLPEKIAFLKKPSSYPDESKNIEVIETHHSWVFLTRLFAYKLKKPVRNELHDYTTLESRHLNCLDELRLNRRLTGEIYLKVVALVVYQDGSLQLDGKGQIVDWLVKMIRIPAVNMLDQSIKDKTVTSREIDQAATLLARFYKSALPENLNFPLQLERLETEINKNKHVLSNPLFGLDSDLVQESTKDLYEFLTGSSDLFKKRILEQKIIEGHGDLRPEHICLRPRPLFIDCLEFSKPLRILDPVDDLSYLSLECDFLGVPQIGERFFEVYTSITHDRIPEALKYFYKALRAFVIARLAALHHLEPKQKDGSRWLRKAETYLRYTRSNIARLKLNV